MKIDKMVEKINKIVEEAVKDKVLLLHIIIAIGIIFLGLVMNLAKIEFMILILVVSNSLRSSINFSLIKDPQKRIRKGAVLIFNAVFALIIGYILFCTDTKLSIPLLLERISYSKSHTYLLCLLLIPSLVILLKILLKKGRALTGGIISGHAAYCTTVLILTMDSLKEQTHPHLFLFLIPAIALIITSRLESLFKLNFGLKILIGFFSVSSALIILIHSIIFNVPAMLILAQGILIFLTIKARSSKKVHRPQEIIWGVLIGSLSFFVLLLF